VRKRGAVLLAAVAIGLSFAAPRLALAYSAAGDRLFPATLQLPQIAPGDEFYLNELNLPLSGGPVGSPSRVNNFTATYAKTITERLGVVIDGTFTSLDRVRRGSLQGWQNLDTELKFLAVTNRPHEFLMSLGLDREFGDTGRPAVGASSSGATTPRLYFGKGLGDLDIGYFRPLAIAGFAGYAVADSRPRPDIVQGGFVLEYSVPYLQSKVQSLDLPDFLRNLTPLTEVTFTTPGGGQSFGARTTLSIAPGVSYAGEGWELAVEGIVPLTQATGRGFGVTAQLHLSLDFLMPETLGRPLLSNP
jgi:hypothetical protein